MESRTKIKLIRTTLDKIDSIPVVNGQFILVTNNIGKSEYIAEDNEYGRQKFSNIEDLSFEREREMIVPSENKIYYIKETGLIYKYTNSTWDCLNKAKVIQVDRVMDLPVVGNPFAIYFIKSKNQIYYWNEDELRYFNAGGGADWHDIETVNANFTVNN